MSAGAGASSGVAFGSGDSVGLLTFSRVIVDAVPAAEEASAEAWEAEAAEKVDESEDSLAVSFFRGFCFLFLGADSGIAAANWLRNSFIRSFVKGPS